MHMYNVNIVIYRKQNTVIGYYVWDLGVSEVYRDVSSKYPD